MLAVDKIALLASADLSAAEVGLAQIPNDDPNGVFPAVVMEQLRAGTAKLCQINDAGQLIGFTVYRVDDFEGWKELVSIATKCTGKRAVRYELDKLLCQLAAEQGCKSIRMHTLRHGLVKEALQNGWETAEIVLRKRL